MKTRLRSFALLTTCMLAGCGGGSNSPGGGNAPPPPPPPVVDNSFSGFLLGLYAQAADSTPKEVNDRNFTFSEDPNLFSSVLGP